MASRASECARSIALEILFSVTYERFSRLAFKLEIPLSPLAVGILRMKGMKIETSASCLPGHFRSAADRNLEWNFLEDFSRHTCSEEGSQPPCSVSSQSCGTHVRAVCIREHAK